MNNKLYFNGVMFKQSVVNKGSQYTRRNRERTENVPVDIIYIYIKVERNSQDSILNVRKDNYIGSEYVPGTHPSFF